VAPGTYFVSAERDGFVAPAPNGPPPGISVSAGQQVTNISVLLNPQGVIRGKVIDENGEPAGDARVEAFTTFSVRGKNQLTRKSATAANKSGEYTLKGLPPGSYYLAAQPAAEAKKGGSDESVGSENAHAAGDQSPAAAKESEPGTPELIRTFYPKALDFESATPIEIGPGQDLTGTNIELRRITTYQIRGKIEVSIAASPGRNWTLSFAPRGSLASDVTGRIITPKSDGTFEIQKVAPGSYTLTLSGLNTAAGSQSSNRSSHMQLLARQDIDVAASDVNGVVLAIIPPINLTGRVALDGSDNANLSQVRVSLTPSGATAVGGFQNVPVKSDGSFNVDSLDPGQYTVRIAGNPVGSYVKSISFNHQDITAAALDLSQGGSGEIEVLLRSGAGEVDGTVLGQGDQTPATSVPGQAGGSGRVTVMLIPEQLAADGSGVFFGSAAPGGTFSIRSVPPGHYYAFAIDRWTSVWQNPEFLREIQNSGMSINVEENNHMQIQLPITGEEQVQQVVARLGLTVQ
ncbi:MAG: carboxypeptidase regulatory-like domain-containing protein, partial [Acidobacteriaceae bacterium]|nr:carboxypeptidase regulatory-like domain-containing protein [Acidobacteriaceae bacterium]